MVWIKFFIWKSFPRASPLSACRACWQVSSIVPSADFFGYPGAFSVICWLFLFIFLKLTTKNPFQFWNDSSFYTTLWIWRCTYCFGCIIRSLVNWISCNEIICVLQLSVNGSTAAPCEDGSVHQLSLCTSPSITASAAGRRDFFTKCVGWLNKPMESWAVRQPSRTTFQFVFESYRVWL